MPGGRVTGGAAVSGGCSVTSGFSVTSETKEFDVGFLHAVSISTSFSKYLTLPSHTPGFVRI